MSDSFEFLPTGKTVHYYPNNAPTPVMAFVTRCNANGALDLLVPRGGGLPAIANVFHIDSQELKDRPELQRDSGAWDFADERPMRKIKEHIDDEIKLREQARRDRSAAELKEHERLANERLIQIYASQGADAGTVALKVNKKGVTKSYVLEVFEKLGIKEAITA